MTAKMRGPLLSRRVLFKAAALTSAAVLVTPSITALTADAAPARSVKTLNDLPRVFGTPTDLARTSSKTVWTRDADGSVQVFDKKRDVWTSTRRHKWATVVKFGTVKLARWGRPTGRNQLVMVFGHPPKAAAPPTKPRPTTRPTPPTKHTPTTKPAPTTTAAPTSRSTPTTRPALVDYAPAKQPSLQEQPPPELAATGLDLGSLGLTAGVLLSAGTGLLAWRGRRMSPGSTSSDSQT